MSAVVGLAVLAGLCYAQTNEVTSVNVVGYIRTTIKARGWAMVSVPFTQTDGDVTYTVDQILPGAPAGTKAWFYRGGGWKSEAVVAFPPPAHWSPATNIFIRGDALFVNNPGASDIQVDVMGEVPDSRTAPTTTVYVASGWTLLGFSYPADVLLTNTTLRVKAAAGDKIWWWDPDKVGGAGWQSATMVAFPPPAKWSPANTILKAGRGYFYSRGGLGFTWDQQKPYQSP